MGFCPWKEIKPQDVDEVQIPPRSKNFPFTSRDFIFQTVKAHVKKEFIECRSKRPQTSSRFFYDIFIEAANTARNTASPVANSEYFSDFWNISSLNT